MTRIYLLLCLNTVALTLFAQTNASKPTQTIRGHIVDKESKFPLIGATILIETTNPQQGATANAAGEFAIEGVATGRHTISISLLGYKTLTVENVIVNSGKETVFDGALEESAIVQKEVLIVATKQGDVRNEMATVSARTFSIEETGRYAGSRGDPARMASNFAGVQGADDSRNDIVIRGNAPSSVLWRFEGVDIFNPNHFSTPGTGGSPVSILNNKWLGNSDFFTGAFPADYGNSVAGAFDLRMRNGNNAKTEVSAQLGFLGTEVLAEGPFSKNSKASWLASYRYSTLSVIGFLGVNFGTDAIPRYQDGAFRFNFPLKNNASIAVFGVGGTSDIDILVSDKKKATGTDLYAQNDRDQYFHSRLGIFGLTYNKAFNTKTFTRATLMVQREQTLAEDNLVFRHLASDSTYINDSLTKSLRYDFAQTKLSLAWVLNHKISNTWTMKGGVNLDNYTMRFYDTLRKGETPYNNGVPNPEYAKFLPRWGANANAILVQPYLQAKYQPTDRLSLTMGLHSQYFSLGNALSAIEPRLGAKYALPNKQGLSFGAGLHSQIQSTYLYFARNNLRTNLNDYTTYNQNMGLTKSGHLVAGYQKIFGQRTLLKTEIYYQYLYDIPVEANVASSFSIVNTGSSFTLIEAPQLTNKGIGRNYGIEFTLEKGFSKHYYYMLTASLFDAQYQGSNGVWHNTDYNGKYATNALFAYEFEINKKQSINIGAKITLAGGRWHGEIDTLASSQTKIVTYKNNEKYNTYQFAPYFRTDLKLNYKINTQRITHEIGIDLVNLLDTKNVLRYSWVPVPTNPLQGSVKQEYQLGLLPLFYYRIDFGIKPKLR